MMTTVPNISARLLSACFAHGQQHYPEESCGLLSGPATAENALDTFSPVPNVMNGLHAKNPARYPRTGKNAIDAL